MLHGKRVFEWGMIGSQMALFANANRDPKRSQPFQVVDFVPPDLRPFLRAPRSRNQLTRSALHALKPLLKKG